MIPETDRLTIEALYDRLAAAWEELVRVTGHATGQQAKAHALLGHDPGAGELAAYEELVDRTNAHINEARRNVTAYEVALRRAIGQPIPAPIEAQFPECPERAEPAPKGGLL